MIGIIDYGMGNLHSVYKAFKRIGAESEIFKASQFINKYEKIILPGVGNFKMGMENLKSAGLVDIIKELVLGEKTPILGICLGMQLLTNSSEEGDVEGLNLIDAKTIHFKNLDISEELKIPHIGWNNIRNMTDSELLKGCDNEMLYFVHSYAVICNNMVDVICETNYGATFHSGVQKGNIYGVQFHPEKSHKTGLRILQNFVNIKKQ
jgi:imidazole glycerol-phosphate synthase subunit HisH